jgi:hypothetical protein
VAFVLHFVPVFCPPKKRTKELVFLGKEKTIHQPPNAGFNGKKNQKFYSFNSHNISIPLLRGLGGGIPKS